MGGMLPPSKKIEKNQENNKKIKSNVIHELVYRTEFAKAVRYGGTFSIIFVREVEHEIDPEKMMEGNEHSEWGGGGLEGIGRLIYEIPPW